MSLGKRLRSVLGGTGNENVCSLEFSWNSHVAPGKATTWVLAVEFSGFFPCQADQPCIVFEDFIDTGFNV